MKIIIDAMGGDNAPGEIVKGAVMAAREYNVDIILTGKTEEILKCLRDMGEKDLPKGIEIANATEVVEMHDDPASAVRVKKDSSMTVGLKMLKDGAADAFVSAGSTGALLSGATLVTKRIRGIRRAAMAPLIPNKGDGMVLIDCGANAECTPEYLLQFAYMGSYYAQNVLGRENPRVGLLNVGSEDTKGDELRKVTYKLLAEAHEAGRINFVGNVEANTAMNAVCDVLVADGFTGNIFLKCFEGVGKLLLGEIKGLFMKSTKNKLAAAVVKGDVQGLKKKFDASEVGGTALLGISKPVIKAHGSSNAYAIKNAVRQAVTTVSSGVTELIEKNVEYMKISETNSAE